MLKKIPALFLVLCSFSAIAKPVNPLCEEAQGASFGSGDGSKLNPYLICNHAQFGLISQDNTLLSKSFKLGSDLSFMDKVFPVIGSPETPFQGNFDGDGYTLSEITLSADIRVYNAPFRNIQNAQIENLTIDDIHSSGTAIAHMAGLVGKAENSILHHINVHHIRLYSRNESGGVVGELINSSLSYTSADGLLEQDFGTDASGGLIGWAVYSDVFASASHVNLSMLYPGPGGGVSGVSSLIGQADYSRIRNIYADGNIDYSSALLLEARGIGGLIGIMHNSLLANGYYAGNISVPSGTEIGGAVGADNSITNYSNAIYWDKQVSGIDQSVIGVGKSTETLKRKTFWVNRGFDSNIWSIKINQYPSLFGSDN